MVSNLTADHIAVFVDRGYPDQTTRQGLERIMALKSGITAMDRDLGAIEDKRKQIFKDQKRLRENLQGLGKTARKKDLRNRYIQRLNGQQARDEKGLKQDRKTKQAQLNDLIANLEQDPES